MGYRTLKKSKWICPLCGAEGSKFVGRHKAKSYGRRHINVYHPDKRDVIDPTIVGEKEYESC